MGLAFRWDRVALEASGQDENLVPHPLENAYPFLGLERDAIDVTDPTNDHPDIHCVLALARVSCAMGSAPMEYRSAGGSPSLSVSQIHVPLLNSLRSQTPECVSWPRRLWSRDPADGLRPSAKTPLIQYAYPSLLGWLLPLGLYCGFCAGVLTHNQNHRPTFVRGWANVWYQAWLSIVYGVAFLAPCLFSLWSMFFINYVQHVDCDPWSEHDHSRNFVGALSNWLVFNAGLHAAHHGQAGLHWSLLPVAHARIASDIHPELKQSSITWFLWRTYGLGAFSDRFRTHQIGRPAWVNPDGVGLDLTIPSIDTTGVGVNASRA